jgi:sugar phosphate isomerase/epimerase
MLKISAFADEISPELDEQIRVCKANSVTHFELRGVAGKNVLDFDQPMRDRIRGTLRENGMGVISIGSPIGKASIAEPWARYFDRFKLAVELAEFFEAPLIRVFSYYPPEGAGKGDMRPHRDEVVRRFEKKIEHLKSRPGITLVHENERHIYGEMAAECLELMKAVNSPQLRMAFDFANFVQAGETPLEAWKLLKPYTVHIHIKDALKDSGKVTPAGEGDGQLAPILKDAYASGYRGFLSLEPHLKYAGHSHGETGEEMFKVAADALKQLCRKIEVPLAGA